MVVAACAVVHLSADASNRDDPVITFSALRLSADMASPSQSCAPATTLQPLTRSAGWHPARWDHRHSRRHPHRQPKGPPPKWNNTYRRSPLSHFSRILHSISQKSLPYPHGASLNDRKGTELWVDPSVFRRHLSLVGQLWSPRHWPWALRQPRRGPEPDDRRAPDSPSGNRRNHRRDRQWGGAGQRE